MRQRPNVKEILPLPGNRYKYLILFGCFQYGRGSQWASRPASRLPLAYNLLYLFEGYDSVRVGFLVREGSMKIETEKDPKKYIILVVLIGIFIYLVM